MEPIAVHRLNVLLRIVETNFRRLLFTLVGRDDQFPLDVVGRFPHLVLRVQRVANALGIAIKAYRFQRDGHFVVGKLHVLAVGKHGHVDTLQVGGEVRQTFTLSTLTLIFALLTNP